MASQLDQTQDESNTSRAWRALMAYRGLSLQVFDTHSQSFDQLPQSDRSLIPSMLDRLSNAVEAVEQNAVLVEKISKLAGIRKRFSPQDMTDLQLQQSVEDFSDVIDALLYVVRDWSMYGEKDRAQMYDPVIRSVHDAAVDAVAAGVVPDVASFSVLVPGAAVGRLPWELAHMGMTVQGVENSALHLLLCNFILNGTASPKRPLAFFPFVHHTGTANTAHDQLAEVNFPDADPRELENGELSMVAGEFLDQYNVENSWDCVVTCFYIDNCHDVIAVVQRISKILKPGGVWVNHGSLDFRYDDSKTESSIEITKEELDLIIARSGMRIIKRDSFRCKAPYSVSGIISEEYLTTFTVAVRV